jgi:hypothetical protein
LVGWSVGQACGWSGERGQHPVHALSSRSSGRRRAHSGPGAGCSGWGEREPLADEATGSRGVAHVREVRLLALDPLLYGRHVLEVTATGRLP